MTPPPPGWSTASCMWVTHVKPPCIPGAGRSQCKLHSPHGQPTSEWEPSLEQSGTAQDPAQGASWTACCYRALPLWSCFWVCPTCVLPPIPPRHSRGPGTGRPWSASTLLTACTMARRFTLFLHRPSSCLFFIRLTPFLLFVCSPSTAFFDVKYTYLRVPLGFSFHLFTYICFSCFHRGCSGNTIYLLTHKKLAQMNTDLLSVARKDRVLPQCLSLPVLCGVIITNHICVQTDLRDTVGLVPDCHKRKAKQKLQ